MTFIQYISYHTSPGSRLSCAMKLATPIHFAERTHFAPFVGSHDSKPNWPTRVSPAIRTPFCVSARGMYVCTSTADPCNIRYRQSPTGTSGLRSVVAPGPLLPPQSSRRHFTPLTMFHAVRPPKTLSRGRWQRPQKSGGVCGITTRPRCGALAPMRALLGDHVWDYEHASIPIAMSHTTTPSLLLPF